jgi:CheY-like chemotaxis protein
MFGRVLVVDDVVLNRNMLCRLLEGHCDETVEAENGEVAVDRLVRAQEAGSPFDLVLMDYQMPVMDGPSAAKAMREMGYEGPIIGVTGNVLASHVRTFVSHGANAVLPKPLDFDALRQTIDGN